MRFLTLIATLFVLFLFIADADAGCGKSGRRGDGILSRFQERRAERVSARRGRVTVT